MLAYHKCLGYTKLECCQIFCSIKVVTWTNKSYDYYLHWLSGYYFSIPKWDHVRLKPQYIG